MAKKPQKYHSRPITTCYSQSPHRRVAAPNAQRQSRSTTVLRAVQAAQNRVTAGDFNRADVYNSFGQHVFSVIRYEKIGIATILVREPASIDVEDMHVRKVGRGRTPVTPNASIPWFVSIPGNAH